MDKIRKLKTAGAIIDFIFAATMLTVLILFTVFAINTLNYYNSADVAESDAYALILLNVSMYGGLYVSGALLVLTAAFTAFAVVDAVKCKKYGKNRRFGIFALLAAFLSAIPLVSCINFVSVSLAYLAPAAILLACIVAEITLACVAYKSFPREKEDNCLSEE